MLRYVYPTLLAACVLFVLWKGQGEQRAVLAALLIGSVNTYLIYLFRGVSWLDPDAVMIGNELLVTAAILAIAYRSRRFWPLPVASFQILALMAQLVSFFGQGLQPYAVGMTQGIWAYLQLIILVVITLRDWRRADRAN